MASLKALARTTSQPDLPLRTLPAYLPYRYSTSFFAERATRVKLLRQNGRLTLRAGPALRPHFAPPSSSTPLHLSYLPLQWRRERDYGV